MKIKYLIISCILIVFFSFSYFYFHLSKQIQIPLAVEINGSYEPIPFILQVEGEVVNQSLHDFLIRDNKFSVILGALLESIRSEDKSKIQELVVVPDKVDADLFSQTLIRSYKNDWTNPYIEMVVDFGNRLLILVAPKYPDQSYKVFLVFDLIDDIYKYNQSSKSELQEVLLSYWLRHSAFKPVEFSVLSIQEKIANFIFKNHKIYLRDDRKAALLFDLNGASVIKEMDIKTQSLYDLYEKNVNFILTDDLTGLEKALEKDSYRFIETWLGSLDSEGKNQLVDYLLQEKEVYGYFNDNAYAMIVYRNKIGDEPFKVIEFWRGSDGDYSIRGIGDGFGDMGKVFSNSIVQEALKNRM